MVKCVDDVKQCNSLTRCVFNSFCTKVELYGSGITFLLVGSDDAAVF